MKKIISIIIFITVDLIGYGQTDSTVKYNSPEELGKFLSKNISKECYDTRIFVTFEIDTVGEKQNFKFTPRACDEKTEQEIINQVKKVQFKPYTKDGKRIKVQMNIPIAF